MDTIEEIIEDAEAYRDSMATVDASGKRIWLYPRKFKGWFHNKRIWFSILLLTIFFVTPFIYIQGNPLFLFNVFARKFVLFGSVFTPHDFHIFALGLITFFVFIILFTVVYGRVWCGWACPQTLFMEIVFRKIEYWIEGDANQQRKLNHQSWNREKIIKKTTKQAIFIAVSIIISHTAMAYLIGIEKVAEIISKPPAENLAGFMGLVLFTGLFYGAFAYLREQVCVAICPYGRLQGVLLGKDSVVISYDHVRGEPRGKINKKTSAEDPPKGDCIDCTLCVQVCPTGIDIRNGTQLECVNCTACIDACDNVMEKVNRPTGLIRYASHNNIEKQEKFRFTPRMIGYTAVLGLLIVLEAFLLVTRGDIETTIVRARGDLFKELPNGNIANTFTIQIVNKSNEELKVNQLKIKDKEGKITIAGNQIIVPKSEVRSGTIVIEMPPGVLKPFKNKLKIEVWSDNKKLEVVGTNFYAPPN